MNKKLIIIFVFVLLIINVNADLSEMIFSMGKNYGITVISAQNPVLGQALTFALNLEANPEAALTETSLGQIEKVIPGFNQVYSAVIDPLNAAKGAAISKIMGELAKNNPKLFNEITNSLGVLEKVKKAANIINDLQVKDGEIVYGKFNTTQDLDISKEFNEKEGYAKLSKGFTYEAINKDNKKTGFILSSEDKEAKFNYGDSVYENFDKANLIFSKDENGNITLKEAYIEVNYKGSTFNFNDIKQFKAAPGSRLKYKNGVLKVEHDENYWQSASNYLNQDIKIDGVGAFYIKENEISCLAYVCTLNKLKLSSNSIVDIQENGYLLKNGEAEFKELDIKVDDKIKNSEVFLTEAINTYDGNYILSKENYIEMNTKTAPIQIEVLKNNKVLDTDNKDKLLFDTGVGSNIKILNRDDQNLIPTITYKGPDTNPTKIINNDFTFKISENKIDMSRPDRLVRNIRYYEWPYQSNAFELTNENKKLRIDAYSQAVLLDKNDQQSVSYNQYDFPISNKLSENQCQSLDCLKSKYPKINFLPPGPNLGLETHPFMVEYVNKWLENNPEALNKIDQFEFSPGIGSHYVNKGINLDEYQVDPLISSDQYWKVYRGLDKGYGILDHEYTHLFNDNINDMEEEYLISTNPEFETKVQKLNSLEEETKKLNKEFTQLSFKEYIGTLSEDEKKKLEQLKQFIPYVYLSTIQERNKLKESWVSENGYEGLNFVYGDYLVKLNNNLLNQESSKEDLKGIIDKVNSAVITGLRNGNQNEFDKAVSKVKGDYKSSGKDFDKILNGENIVDKTKLVTEIMTQIRSSTNYKFWDYDDLITAQISNRRLSNLMQSSNNGEILDELSGIQDVFILQKDENKKSISKDIEEFAEKNGIPSIYALYSSSGYVTSNSLEEIRSKNFAEFDATYMEESINLRKQRVASSNKKLSDSYKFLTQVNFDSGRMNSKEYSDIMQIKCQTPDCMELKCKEYKLICCKDNPNSPYCK